MGVHRQFRLAQEVMQAAQRLRSRDTAGGAAAGVKHVGLKQREETDSAWQRIS